MNDRTYVVTVKADTTDEQIQHAMERAMFRLSEAVWDETPVQPWSITVSEKGIEVDALCYQFEPDEDETDERSPDWQDHLGTGFPQEPDTYDPHGGAKHRDYEEN